MSDAVENPVTDHPAEGNTGPLPEGSPEAPAVVENPLAEGSPAADAPSASGQSGNTGGLVIQDDVPMPALRKRFSSPPDLLGVMLRMVPGQSMLVPQGEGQTVQETAKAVSSKISTMRRAGKVFIQRKEESGVRVWRLADAAS